MNSEPFVTARNLETGQTGKIPRRFFEHPVLNPGVLEEVEPGTKSYHPAMYRSRLTEPAIDPATVEEDEATDPVEVEIIPLEEETTPKKGKDK